MHEEDSENLILTVRNPVFDHGNDSEHIEAEYDEPRFAQKAIKN